MSYKNYHFKIVKKIKKEKMPVTDFMFGLVEDALVGMCFIILMQDFYTLR